jgi:hypothetical protein
MSSSQHRPHLRWAPLAERRKSLGLPELSHSTARRAVATKGGRRLQKSEQSDDCVVAAYKPVADLGTGRTRETLSLESVDSQHMRDLRELRTDAVNKA